MTAKEAAMQGLSKINPKPSNVLGGLAVGLLLVAVA